MREAYRTPSLRCELMALFKQRRKHGIIDKLPTDIKDTVDQMCQADFTYSEIVDYIRDSGYEISVSSVCRYAKSLNASLQSLKMANENFRAIMDEMAKYPQMDTTEGIIRLLSHQVLDAIQNTPEDKWSGMDPVKLIQQSTALVRAASYKQKTDLENKSVLDAGYEQVKILVFEAMAKENPELYRQVSEFLAQQQNKN